MIHRRKAWGEVTTTDVPAAANTSARPLPVQQTLETLLPLVQTVTEGLNDPFRKVEVLRAKLENARARGASAAHINLLEAKLAAAERATGVRVEGEQSQRDWRLLGKVGVATGVGVGVALMLLLVSKAVR